MANDKKWIHLAHHDGCAADLEYVGKKLDVRIDYLHSSGNYNISSERAAKKWRCWENIFADFDGAITSDTAPLARIFLENGWEKPLIIWVCTRFDYTDEATNDCGFPDPEFYTLFSEALQRPNVKIISYTAYEFIHARNRGVNFPANVIKPVGGTGGRTQGLRGHSAIPIHKPSTFFIPPYHNDTHLMDLQGHCHGLGIPAWRGRYDGPGDLADFKAIIHIPYAWSNLALFENWQHGLTYFIPSPEMLMKIAQCREFFWSPPWLPEHLGISEWYCPENRDGFVYFDSWEDLAEKTKAFKKAQHKPKVLALAKRNEKEQLAKWRPLLNV